jgi:lipoxygenase
VGALAERVVLTPAPAERVARPEAHPQSVAARAVVTVRRKRKEDAKGRVAEQMDAYADKLGRSVLLELVSTETDPSKQPPGSFGFEFHGSRTASSLLLH